MKINYFIIPLITLIVAFSGSFLTSGGMGWYKTLKLPEVAPPGSLIGLVWTIIFILTTISALIFWNKTPRDSRFNTIVIFFLINAFLNVFWSYLFFNQHQILASIIEMIVLDITVIVLIILLSQILKLASYLLIPYAVWVAFATYLAYQISLLN
jgi:tryptophan-rich sensory protein